MAFQVTLYSHCSLYHPLLDQGSLYKTEMSASQAGAHVWITSQINVGEIL